MRGGLARSTTPAARRYVANLTSLDAQFKDDLGFVPRQGVDIISAGVIRRLRPQALAPRVREIRPQLSYARYESNGSSPESSGGAETEAIVPAISTEFSDASLLDLTLERDTEVPATAFRPQGIPAGRSIAPGSYHFRAGTLTYTGSNARRLSFTGAWRFGEYYSGTRDGVTAGGRVRDQREARVHGIDDVGHRGLA